MTRKAPDLWEGRWELAERMPVRLCPLSPPLPAQSPRYLRAFLPTGGRLEALVSILSWLPQIGCDRPAVIVEIGAALPLS